MNHSNDTIRRALEQYIKSDPTLIFVNVVVDGRNVAIFPDEVLSKFDELVKGHTK